MCEHKRKDYHEAIRNVVDHLKSKRNELLCEINHDEVEKAKVLGEMDKLRDKLTIIDANLKMKSEFRRDYDKAISQSEGHFIELMQKSEDFLQKARREVLALSHTCGDRKGDCMKMDTFPPQDCENKVELSCPGAVVAFQPSDNGNCINCGNYTCTTIAVPYRANGL